ncbi:MAG: 4Fe-4S dicluster domain-containing protein [Desulfuromonas sp.]|nr:4Fe-4S dicluster domain-containing protein [Desulfuromonas sp.]
MLKQLTQQDLFELFDRLAEQYHLLMPTLLTDGSRELMPWPGSKAAAIDGIIPSMAGEPIQRKPTSHFFPQTDPLVFLKPDGTVSVPQPPDKPLALCGLNREDLAAVAFVDRFFSAEPADDVYLAKRSGALLIGLSGHCGDGSHGDHFLPLAQGLCDIELIAEEPNEEKKEQEKQWLAVVYNAVGEQWLSGFAAGSPQRLELLRHKSVTMGHQQQELLQQASRLLQADQVPDSFWQEISSRCIRCGGCNFVCPTCTCFCVQDRTTTAGTQRSRIWDSCQLDAFMREASGHNPLGTELLRTRRRIHHKLVDDPKRWGEISCVLCGRCDRACPTGIGMVAVCEELVRRFTS